MPRTTKKKVTRPRVKKVQECILCGMELQSKSDLKRHMYIHGDKSNKPYKCTEEPDCTFATVDKTNLKNHINSKHKKIKTHECKECDIFVSDGSALIRHNKRKHKYQTDNTRKPRAKPKFTVNGFEKNKYPHLSNVAERSFIPIIPNNIPTNRIEDALVSSSYEDVPSMADPAAVSPTSQVPSGYTELVYAPKQLDYILTESQPYHNHTFTPEDQFFAPTSAYTTQISAVPISNGTAQASKQQNYLYGTTSLHDTSPQAYAPRDLYHNAIAFQPPVTEMDSWNMNNYHNTFNGYNNQAAYQDSFPILAQRELKMGLKSWAEHSLQQDNPTPAPSAVPSSSIDFDYTMVDPYLFGHYTNF